MDGNNGFISFIIDPIGNIIRYHSRTPTSLGYTSDEMENKNLYEIISSQDDINQLKSRINDTSLLGDVSDITMKLISKEKGIINFHCSLFPIKNKYSNCIKIGMVGEQIKENIETEDTLMTTMLQSNNDETKPNFVPINDTNENDLHNNLKDEHDDHIIPEEYVKYQDIDDKTSDNKADTREFQITIRKGKILDFQNDFASFLSYDPNLFSSLNFYQLFSQKGLNTLKQFYLSRIKDNDNSPYYSSILTYKKDIIDVYVTHSETKFENNNAEKIIFTIL